MAERKWTEEELAMLRSLWGGRLSSFQIGALMGRTRSSVSGKAHKIGLPTAQKTQSVFVDQLVRARNRTASPKDRPLQQVDGLPSLNLSLVEIETHQCRWATSGSGADTLFCALPADEPYGYCKDHHGLAYVPERPKSRVDRTDYHLFRRAA